MEFLHEIFVGVCERGSGKKEGKQPGKQTSKQAKLGNGLKPRRWNCAHHQLIDTLVVWWVEKIQTSFCLFPKVFPTTLSV
jgi:hypothetical protein